MMKKYETVIIGGGASGLYLASYLKKGAILLEKGERLGKKLSATGNGQGNVSNLNMGIDHFFTGNLNEKDKIARVLDKNGKDELISFFNSLGAMLITDERGRMYPSSRQASSITDLLRFSLFNKDNLEICTLSKAQKIEKTATGYLIFVESVTKEEKKNYQILAKNVVFCAGGKAAKNFGSDGACFQLAKSLGHSITPLFPSLVPFKLDALDCKTLKGIRISPAYITGVIDGNKIAEVKGDIIFTDYGISGDAIFKISAFLSGEINENTFLNIDFLPSFSEEDLSIIIEKKLKNRDIPETEILCGILNNQVGRVVLKRCKTRDSKLIAKQIKCFKVKVTGTLDFDYAQVSKGGIPLEEVTNNLESKKAKGVYFIGEILDVDGECGGYNLQWAFSSAKMVAETINNQ